MEEKFLEVVKIRSFKNESKGGNFILLDFKVYYKV